MISITQLSKRYGRKAEPALKEISLTIGNGIFGLLGPNGAGKTTLMRILATLAEPSSGSVTIAGYDICRDRAKIRPLLGFLPQNFGFYARLTAYENLDYFALLSGLDRSRRSRIEEVLRRVNLHDVARKRVGTFSGGMKQRLGIAQALLNHPKVLIVDEPTVGLDPTERVRFRTLLAELATQSTVLLSTHIVADIANTCTQLAVLQRGNIVYQGAASGLIAHARGQVWGTQISTDLLPQLEQRCVVAAVNHTTEGVDVRVIGTPPSDLAVAQLEPTLEDGYLAAVNTDRFFAQQRSILSVSAHQGDVYSVRGEV